VGFVNNVEAAVVREAEECRQGLIRQVSSPVRWQESVRRLVAEGVETFVEVGPGEVLGGLIRKIAPGCRVLSVQDPESLEKTAAALADVPAA
jgi:[acyl-carrier-protein] S-malonyltransferase